MQQAALTEEHMRLIEALRQSGVDVEYEHRSATATGLGFTGSGDQAATLDYGVTGVDGSGGASVGASGISWEMVSTEAAIPVLFTLGGLAILAAIGLAMARQWRSAGLAAVGGGLLIGLGVMAKEYPWLLALGALVALVAIGWFVWSEVRRVRSGLALRAVTKAVEQSSQAAQGEIKPRVEQELGRRVDEIRPVIRKAKGN